MNDRERISLKARSFFDDLWARGDPWQLESSGFERERYRRLIDLLNDAKYPRILEIGCGAGAFTRLLNPLAQSILAMDVSPEAIAKAQAAQGASTNVEFRAANIMEYDPKSDAPWDLIIMSDMVYFLGWLYPLFDIYWLATGLFGATRSGGQLLLANCYGGPEDYLMRPALIHTYRDLFINVGYRIKSEETFRGTKNNVEIDVLITLFEKLNERHPGAANV